MGLPFLKRQPQLWALPSPCSALRGFSEIHPPPLLLLWVSWAGWLSSLLPEFSFIQYHTFYSKTAKVGVVEMPEIYLIVLSWGYGTKARRIIHPITAVICQNKCPKTWILKPQWFIQSLCSLGCRYAVWWLPGWKLTNYWITSCFNYKLLNRQSQKMEDSFARGWKVTEVRVKVEGRGNLPLVDH